MLRIPPGFDTRKCRWFKESQLKKVIVPRSITVLGNNMFDNCAQLSEVIFEPGSCLEQIGNYCFAHCKLHEIVIPKKVKSIGDGAFFWCHWLFSLCFEEGSRLKEVGAHAFSGTQLRQDNVVYPKTLRKKGHG